MAWSPWFLGRDATQWRAPVDAFRPERWDPADALWAPTPSDEVRGARSSGPRRPARDVERPTDPRGPF